MVNFLKRLKTLFNNRKIYKEFNDSKTYFYDSNNISNNINYNKSLKENEICIINGNYIDFLFKSEDSIGLLNNANMYVRGGGYRLAQIAQEESICYVSNLYCELSKMRKYYLLNWLNFNLYNSDNIFYSKGIVFFRDSNYNLLNVDDYVNVDILSISAVNRRYMLIKNEKRIKKVMLNRIRNIINIFIENGNETIFLSPFGCGAYGNNVEDVANYFKEVLFEEDKIKYFKNVTFVCFKDFEYEIFKNIFNDNLVK